MLNQAGTPTIISFSLQHRQTPETVKIGGFPGL
jgi:hypothetical protein